MEREILAQGEHLEAAKRSRAAGVATLAITRDVGRPQAPREDPGSRRSPTTAG